jgi:dipeptidyl aminopeptidase/acylaminoacyl peptidase
MKMKSTIVIALLSVASVMPAQGAPFDAAAAFGARPSIEGLSLSPDGKHVAYLVPIPGQGSAVITTALEKGSQPRTALVAKGQPDRLRGCAWVSNDRLVCTVYGVNKDAMVGYQPWTRLFAVDADGHNLKVLSRLDNQTSARGVAFGGGTVIDWLPDEEGSVLMARIYVPDARSHSGSSDYGLGVDRIDTRTLAMSHVEVPTSDAIEYISDGRGAVRIEGIRQVDRDTDTGVIRYRFRTANSREWTTLGDFNTVTDEGFRPLAVDHDLNVAYGVKKKDGRLAIYTHSLDGSAHEELIYANPDVDVDGLIRIGRRRHVVGASYATAYPHAEFLTSDVKEMLSSISRALPNTPLRVVDSSIDESKMLIYAGSDSDPGVYYIFDRPAHKLQTFLVVREELEGVKLANQRPISYPAGDGVMIPAYLTLPPGREDAKGLPAIVLPHGGPSARDEWGFDWLSQFFANRGYAVLQPEFRGSAGYGDAWFRQNGFRSWRVAIGDILAAGHWLVGQGVDPAKLGIFGWSYGGYAALQCAVTEPGTFKAVVAVAPVTDLVAFREDFHKYTSYDLLSEFIGAGPHLKEGSPIEHAENIKVPVLLFHGEADTNVSIAQSKRMADKLKSVGGKVELITFDKLDHNLEDASARTQMLSKADAFLRQALGM